MNFRKLTAPMVTAAFAAAASFSANSAIDLDAATDQVVSIASELIEAATADGNGRYGVIGAGNSLDIAGLAGFGTSATNTSYYRYDLTGAVFAAAPTLVSQSDGAETPAGVIVLGGAAQDDFVIFEVTPGTNNILASSSATLAPAAAAADFIDMDPTVTSTVTYAIYGTEIDSVNETNALATASANVLKSVSGYTDADAVTATALVATVATEFKAWSTGAGGTGLSATLGLLGTYSSTAAADTSVFTLGGVASANTDYYTNAQDVTITGDMSVGTFFVDDDASCDNAVTGAAAVACDKNTAETACTATAAGTQADFFVCITLPADEAIGKNAYTLAGATNTTSVSLGSLSYDTTSITVPYVSTYSDYNQRIYINNKGAAAAYYSTTFDTESGTTAAAGTAGTGTIAGGEIAMIKVSDLVTLTGGTRAAAVIEIEAAATDIEATTQIINLSDGGTDTLTLTVQ